jgi:hypothetical protein
MSEREQAFNADYFNRTGVHWTHHFGKFEETTCLLVGCYDHNVLLSDENGPRPPPFLNMWPAEAIGDVHRIVSDAGKW